MIVCVYACVCTLCIRSTTFPRFNLDSNIAHEDVALFRASTGHVEMEQRKELSMSVLDENAIRFDALSCDRDITVSRRRLAP